MNRVAREIVGRKRIVCGRSVSWWDDELRGMVRERDVHATRECLKEVWMLGMSIVRSVEY